MAEYLILIYGDEAAFAKADPATGDQMMKEHVVFGERNAASLRGGNALQPTSTATSLRTDESGNVSVTDGAFAETKEALGGYYVIEAGDLDEA
ncbi:MAG: YciI family protein, partial [Acidimicrobiales bacterium]